MRVEPDWSGRCACSQTAAHSAIASITGWRKSFGCGLVKRMRSMPSTASHGAQQLAELGVDVGQQVAAPRVDVLAEQRQLAHALVRELRRPRRATSPGRRLTSRPRTAGTMQ